ncbi:MAG: lamin tail domain-containing protein [Chitinophagaceae bacterium]|nr:lamin tail domain-containing protein [Chitinophagaceae bacterium]
MKKLYLLFALFLVSYFSDAQIIFNEVEADAGNFENAGGEWIELKNIGASPIDLSCYKISNGSTEMTIPFGVSVPANGYLLIANAGKVMCSTCDFKNLNGQFTLNSQGYGTGIGAYANTVFLNTNTIANGGCGCLFGTGALNNGSGTGDRLVLFDDSGNILDALMWGGGNNYGSANLTVNFTGVGACAPLPGVIIPQVTDAVYDGRKICNDVTSCNSSFARTPDGNNGATVTWNQTGNLACSNCTNPCGIATNTASNDMPTPGLDNGAPTWNATLNGNPISGTSSSIVVCGSSPVNFVFESYNFSNTATDATQSTGLLGSFYQVNNGTPTNFTATNFNPTTGVTTLTATVTPGAGTTTYNFVMGESNTNCSSCPGTATVSDVSNPLVAAKECYLNHTVFVIREEPLGGTPSVSCSLLGSITVSGATGTNVKYELQKQTTIGGTFTTIAGPQSSNLFGGVVDDDADPALPNYQVLITTTNSVCSNSPTLTATVPNACLGNPVCAAYVTSNPGAPTFTPASGSTACAGSQVQFTVDITGVCTNGTVDVMYDPNPLFDPYTTGVLLGSGTTTVGATPPTQTATSKVFINEFAPRPAQGACPGTPNGQNPNSGEWIELYNPGPNNVDIGGWIISDGDWTATIPAGIKILANNYYLIGGGGTFCSSGQLPDLNVETCNCATVSPTTQDIMNLTDGSEQIVLFDCTGAVVDAVLWNGGQSLPDTTANTAPTTGCGNYISQKNVNLPAAASMTSSGGSLSGNPNIGRYRTSTNTWVTTTTALLNTTPKAANPGGNWDGNSIPFGSQCPPPPVSAVVTFNLPDTCDQFSSTNVTVKAIYKPDPVSPCTKSAVTATATYTIPPCSVMTISGDGEYCDPSNAPVLLTTSDPLVGNYTVTIGNGTSSIPLSGLSGNGPFVTTVSTSGNWVINSITPPTGVCPPKKVGSANIIIHPIPAITTVPATTDFCYLYGYDLSNINASIVTNPPASTFNWYDAPVGGNLIFPTLVYPTGDTTFYAEPSTGIPANCTGARTAVNLTVKPIPDAPNLSCENNTLFILPLAQNCVPVPCPSVEYSPDGVNWSSNTVYTSTDPGWNGWGSATNSQLYIRNTAVNSCYVIVTYFNPCNYPLPATLFAFTGRLLQNNTIGLKWQSGLETNLSYYDIERSSDKLHFTSIGEVAAQGGSHTYETNDVHPLSGDNYYRLKMVDKDNQFTYSEVVKVSTPLQVKIGEVFPNPSSQDVHLPVSCLKKSKVLIQVSNITNQVVLTQEELVESGSNDIQLAVQNLSKGNYILKCTIDKNTEYRKFSIN